MVAQVRAPAGGVCEQEAMDGVEQGEVHLQVLVLPGGGEGGLRMVGADVVEPFDLFVNGLGVGTANVREVAVAVEAILVAFAAVYSEAVDGVGLFARDLDERTGALVAIALLVRGGGCLDDFDACTRAKEFQGSGFWVAVLILGVNGDDVVGEGAFGPCISGVVPDITPVCCHFSPLGDVDDAQAVVVAMAAIAITVEIEGGVTFWVSAAQDSDVPAGKPFGVVRQVGVLFGYYIGVPVPEGVFVAFLRERSVLRFFQQAGVAIAVVGAQNFGVDGINASAFSGVSDDGVLQVRVEHAGHAFQSQAVAVEVLKGVQVFEERTGFGFVAVRVGVSDEQFWDVAQQVEVHGGIGGRFGAEAVEVEGIFEEDFKTFYSAAHALRSVKEYADSGA